MVLLIKVNKGFIFIKNKKVGYIDPEFLDSESGKKLPRG